MAQQLKPLPVEIVDRPPAGTPHQPPVLDEGGAQESVAGRAGRDPVHPLVAEAIAHELRATLALIAAYSQTVQHLPLDNDVRLRYLERISTASMSLSELADEVLTVATEPSRSSEPALEPVSLRHVYARLEAQFRRAGDAPARLRLDVPVELPLVEADPLWITLVLRNLVTNAIKYAAAGTISVSAWASGEWVMTRVSDEGAGVPANERRRLFEPMFRGRRARRSGTPGSGQGLYLCKLLVEAHGGRIWVDDTSDGFAVAFSLPRARRPFLIGSDAYMAALVAVGPGKAVPPGA